MFIVDRDIILDFSVFFLVFLGVRLSVLVQLIDWKDLSLK